MAIGALIVYTTMISPSLAEIQTLRAERESKLVTLADYREAIEETNNVIEASQSLASLTDSFNQVIPPEEQIPSLLNQLYGLARMSGALVDSINFQFMPIESSSESSILKPIGIVRSTVKCSGNYESIKSYVKLLETNIRLMDVYSIDVAGGNEENPSLSYTVVIDAYYQSQ